MIINYINETSIILFKVVINYWIAPSFGLDNKPDGEKDFTHSEFKTEKKKKTEKPITF